MSRTELTPNSSSYVHTRTFSFHCGELRELRSGGVDGIGMAWSGLRVVCVREQKDAHSSPVCRSRVTAGKKKKKRPAPPSLALILFSEEGWESTDTEPHF